MYLLLSDTIASAFTTINYRGSMNLSKFVCATILAAVGTASVSLPSFAMRPGKIIGNDYGSSVNMRSGPSKNNVAIAQTSVGSNAIVLSETPGNDGYTWFKVNSKGSIGWVRSDLVTMNRKCGLYAMLRANDGPKTIINLRSSASRSSSIVKEAVHGDHVRVHRAINGNDGYTWSYIEHSSGAQGWVRGDLVQYG
jgi:uncharacterized protein YraI